MNLIVGILMFFVVKLATDYLFEKIYCKRNYKKRAKCRCWTCRFYDECEFTAHHQKKINQ